MPVTFYRLGRDFTRWGIGDRNCLSPGYSIWGILYFVTPALKA